MKRNVLIFLFLVSTGIILGQVSADLQPASVSTRVNAPVFVEVADGNVPVKITESRYPLYAGHTVIFSEKTLSRGQWSSADDSDFWIWQMGITVKKAEALNLYFRNVELNNGERLFIWSNDRKQRIGAFTSYNNGNILATEPIRGDSIVIEFNTPKKDRSLPFSVYEIGIVSASFDQQERDFGDADACEILVNCPEGNPYQEQKRGVARVLVKDGSSLFWCSGSLVNNTNRDATPYFLTAHHCGEQSSEEDYSEWVFFFNYEAQGCEMPVLEPKHESISGAKLMADGQKTTTGSDFKLLLLQEEIPAEYDPYFNGWSRSESASGSGVGIHHPSGDLKMISSYLNPLVSTAYNDPDPNPEGRFWMVHWSETESGKGVTEGGSSGSPLLDEEGYIVGTLSGGRASCSRPNEPDYYGKFSEHWENNGIDSSQQLKPWLDPANTNTPALRGMGLDTSSLRADFVSNITEVKVGGEVRFFNKSQGEVTQFTWEFEGGDPEFAESETPPPVTYYKTGAYKVKLTVKSETESDILAIDNYIRVLPNLYPNPSSTGQFNIVFGESIPEDVEFSVYSMDGRNIEFNQSASSENIVTIDIGNHPQGVYLIQVRTEGTVQNMKASNKFYYNSN